MDQPAQLIKLGFTNRLLDDFKKSCEGVNGPDAQFWRRHTVRCLFGFLEAWMSVNRNHIVRDVLRERGDGYLKTDDDRTYIAGLLAATDPHEWLLSENGKGKQHKRKLRFLPLLKANFRLILFLGGVPDNEVATFLTSSDWQKVHKAVEVRDRLMHPHVHEDVFVSDDEVACIESVRNLMCSMWGKLNLADVPVVYDDD